MRSFSLATALILATSAGAHAGGFAAPVVDVEPAAPVVVATQAPAWQGAYVGASLGYALNGDDRIGLRDPAAGTMTNIGNADVHGGNFSIRGGYRIQRDRWVVGPELSYTAGAIEDKFDYPGGSFESKVNSEISLRLKTGYLVRDDMMVYGIAGVTKGDFTYVQNGVEKDYDADGYVMGLGVEKMLSARMSVTGEIEHSSFGKTEFETPSGDITQATPEHSNMKLGLNFKF